MNEEIQVPVWYSPGDGKMYRRDYLPWNHPEQTYNYIKRVYNVNPSLYGIEKPLPTSVNTKVCPECGQPVQIDEEML